MRRPRSRSRGSLVAVLDLGTTKTVCFIARIVDEGRAQVVGIGHQASRGMRAGSIVDLAAAEKAIAMAVQSAEQMAGEQITEIVVNLSGGRPVSRTLSIEVPLGGRAVVEQDLRRASRAFTAGLPAEEEAVHAIPTGYRLDGARGILHPVGMVGDRLGIDVHLVAAGAGAARNLTSCVNRAHLEVEALMLSPYASGIACLVDDEVELGCAVIDMGGGTTSTAVFIEGRLVYGDVLPIGGSHVTNDIARGLTTPVAHAERLKTLHGSTLPAAADDREIVEVPQVGEDDAAQTARLPKSLLTGIIQPRMEEIFEMVRGRLEESGLDRAFGRRVVLTGGASQLQGARELAQLVLDKQVRMGRPTGMDGLTGETTGPEFATATGLLLLTIDPRADLVASGMAFEDAASTSFWSRIGGWFKGGS